MTSSKISSKSPASLLQNRNATESVRGAAWVSALLEMLLRQLRFLFQIALEMMKYLLIVVSCETLLDISFHFVPEIDNVNLSLENHISDQESRLLKKHCFL